MPRFLIERELPGAGRLTPEQLIEIGKTSCDALRQLGPDIQWVHSYVTANRITCVYFAPNADLIREHARLGKFPCNSVEEITAIIDPGTAEGSLWVSASLAAVA